MNIFKSNRIIAAGLSVLLLAVTVSCKVEKYSAPETNTTELFRDTNLTDTVTIADIKWSEYFSDTYLLNLIEEGLKNNFDLKAAETRIRQAEIGLEMARAAYFPDIAVAGTIEQRRVSNGTRGRDVLGYDTESYSLGISASWEADIWGKIARQKRARYAQFLSSQAYRNLIQTSLIANIAASYYTLLAMDEQLKITEETIALLKENTETMEHLKEARILNAAAIEQSKALLNGTMASVPDLKYRIKELENTICFLTGRISGSIERSDISKQAVPTGLKYGIPAQLLSRRPDIKQAELSFMAAFNLTQAAKASLYPSVTLRSTSFLGLGTQNTLAGFFKPENILANIAGGIAQPIFARKQLSGNLKITKVQQEEALIMFEKAVLNAGKEVSDILYRYETSANKNSVRNMQIQSLTTAVEYTKDLLIAGEANYLEVLNSEQGLLQARLSQTSDKLEQLQATVNLYKALGGGY